MSLSHAETGSTGGMGHDDTESSGDILLHVCLLVFSWIGWSWMVQTIYDLTSRIDLKISPSHQAGKEKVKLVGAA